MLVQPVLLKSKKKKCVVFLLIFTSLYHPGSARWRGWCPKIGKLQREGKIGPDQGYLLEADIDFSFLRKYTIYNTNPEGGLLNKVYTGRLCPKVKILLYTCPFLTEQVAFLYTFHRKWYAFHIPTVHFYRP